MRRLAAVLVCGLLAGGGAGAFAHKAPPRHRKPHRHHRHKAKHKPTVRPAQRPAVSTTPTPPATTITPPPTTTGATPAPAPPAATAPAVPAATAPLAHTLGVTASDAPSGAFVLSVSRTVLGAGSELIEFRNISQDGHDLRIDAGDGTQQAAWDELDSLAAPVAKTLPLAAGTYRVYCTLHLGMERQLTVQ